MAVAVGISGIRLEDAADLEPGIAAAFAHDWPVLVGAVVNREELPIPPRITLEMARGVTLHMVKAVMSGRVVGPTRYSISPSPISGDKSGR